MGTLLRTVPHSGSVQHGTASLCPGSPAPGPPPGPVLITFHGCAQSYACLGGWTSEPSPPALPSWVSYLSSSSLSYLILKKGEKCICKDGK